MNWIRFIAFRVVRTIAVLGVIVVVTFLMMRLVPGDPARLIAGFAADNNAVEQMRSEMGLDRSLTVQFGQYLSGLFHGDLGVSFATDESVVTVIGDRIGPTAELASFAAVLILVLGLPLGIWSAVISRGTGRRAEVLFSAGTGILASLPSYLTATFLVFLFAVTWRVFPVAGIGSWNALVLPAVAVAVRPAMVVARILRVRTLEVLEAPYIRTARSKRLSTAALYLRHVAPNAITTVVALTGVLFAGLIGGTVVIEQVFARPGLGTTLVHSVIIGDYPVVQGITLVIAVAVVVVNSLADVVLGIVDPQTREGALQ